MVTDANIHEISIENILERIDDKLPYIDRMRIWLTDKPHFKLSELRKFCGGVRGEQGFMKFKNKVTGEWITVPPWRYNLTLSQPTIDALIFLMNNLKLVQYLINYVELTLDFTAATHEHRNFLRGFFDRCWVKSHNVSGDTVLKVTKIPPDTKAKPHDHVDDSMTWIGTTYIGSVRSPIRYVIYSDKPSKINKKFCCHLEVRFQGSAALKDAGLNTFFSYLKDDFFYKFWRKHLRLRRPKDKELVKSEIERIVRKKMERKSDHVSENTNLFRRLRGGKEHTIAITTTTLRRLFSKDLMYRAQNIVDFGKYVDSKRRFLETLPNDELLPQRGVMIIYKNEHTEQHNTETETIDTINTTHRTIKVKHNKTTSNIKHTTLTKKKIPINKK
jgi:hypothetical protein